LKRLFDKGILDNISLDESPYFIFIFFIASLVVIVVAVRSIDLYTTAVSVRTLIFLLLPPPNPVKNFIAFFILGLYGIIIII